MPYADRNSQRFYQQRWLLARRNAWFEGKVCSRCGSTEALELDHLDPDKKVNHRIWSWSQERRDAELAKCQVLCHICHKKKSAEECRHGEQHPRAMLTTSEVTEIRSRVAAGESQAAVGRYFNIDRRHVWEIVHYKTRVHE